MGLSLLPVSGRNRPPSRRLAESIASSVRPPPQLPDWSFIQPTSTGAPNVMKYARLRIAPIMTPTDWGVAWGNSIGIVKKGET